MEILPLLQCLSTTLDATTIRQLSTIISAVLPMTGRVTMLGISRWADKGGSYRTVQRFFHGNLSWLPIAWKFFLAFLYKPAHTYVLAGDETIVTKAGHKTYGIDWFYSSTKEKVTKSISFFTLAIVSVEEGRSYPLYAEQVVRTAEEKEIAKAKKAKQQTQKQVKGKKGKAKPTQGKRGRPKGSQNKNKADVELSPELTRIQKMVLAVLNVVGQVVKLPYLVLDGHFGHHAAMQMSLRSGLHHISRLRSNSSLYFPYEGEQAKRGPRKKYGDKIDYENLPAKYLQSKVSSDKMIVMTYQMTMLHKEYAQPLNIVILTKFDLNSQKMGQVILFSSDLELEAEKLVHYYRLRFQIEFNFRDAKQFWGLEDFMVTDPVAIANSANFSLFMINVACVLLAQLNQENSEHGVIDLKAHFRGRKYVREVLKILPEKPDPILIDELFASVGRLGSIYQAAPA
jgi:putative transposase